jgi:hypothetical protein
MVAGLNVICDFRELSRGGMTNQASAICDNVIFDIIAAQRSSDYLGVFEIADSGIDLIQSMTAATLSECTMCNRNAAGSRCIKD